MTGSPKAPLCFRLFLFFFFFITSPPPSAPANSDELDPSGARFNSGLTPAAGLEDDDGRKEDGMEDGFGTAGLGREKRLKEDRPRSGCFGSGTGVGSGIASIGVDSEEEEEEERVVDDEGAAEDEVEGRGKVG